MASVSTDAGAPGPSALGTAGAGPGRAGRSFMSQKIPVDPLR